MEKIRVLLVDDEADFRRPIAKRLDRRGFEIHEAGSGEEALDYLEANPIDVVVLDVKMPGLNGIDTMARIKERFQGIEVILLTGHSSTEDGVEGIKQGAFDYLTKPIELTHLAGKINQATEKRRREIEKKREAEFRTKMEQQMVATERLASLGTLSTGIAHEIDNPLAIIKESAGYMRLVLNKDEMSGIPRQKDLSNAVDKIEAAVDRTRRITHQLLGFVRKQEKSFMETDLKALADETLEFLGKEARQNNIEISIEAGGERVIWSNPYEIRQVLINLVTNAIHATPAGGRITIRIEDQGEGVALTVADTGSGIPKENLDKIFEPFFTTKPPGQGTGLGLYVSRGIVGRLGGKMRVDSRVGRGTKIVIELPRCQPPVEGEITDNENICYEILNRIKGEPES
ncbi:MAG: response regulator [Desulfobacterales bacterium]|nr:response regulator [Desulfobacterales bacterium]